MSLETFTMALFTACNAARIIAYLPQIYRVATDPYGARGLSYATWSMFLAANLSTFAYALANRGDIWMAICFAVSAICCAAILALGLWRNACCKDVAVGACGAQPSTER